MGCVSLSCKNEFLAELTHRQSHAAGEPSLNWHEIQQLLKHTCLDVLLLLDCCFAAQAGRSREDGIGKFELLAAAAMGMKTPGPGKRSFTTALMRLLQDASESDEELLVVDLQRQLLRSEVDLYATPVYAPLNPNRASISLRPLIATVHPPQTSKLRQGAQFEVLLDVVQPLDQAFVNDITSWLGKAAPLGITTVEVKNKSESVLDTTACIQDFVNTDLLRNGTLTRSLPNAAYKDIRQTWADISALLTKYKISYNNQQTKQYKAGYIASDLIAFVGDLEVTNSAFTDQLGRWLLNSASARDPKSLDELIHDPASEKLHLVDQLQLRRAICSADQKPSPMQPGSYSPCATNRLQEFRAYGPYINPAQLPGLRRRIASLAALLSQPKDDHFLCLPCCNWYEETHRHRFVLEFSVPEQYQLYPADYQALHTSILKSKGSNRPSLDERFCISSKLARAVQKWHSVGWVHQGISSHNIVFLFNDKKKLAFSRPILLGFQYSRPKFTPSIGWTMNDLPAAIYRHPDRQGDARHGHTKLHDIYSLGVVLLEVGLWQTATDIVMINKMKPTSITAESLRDRLISACESRLSHYAGDAYQEAVSACLRSNFDVVMDDSEDTALTTAFQEKVVAKLFAGIKI